MRRGLAELHPVAALVVWHFLYGVAQGGAGHGGCMLAEEVAEEVHADALAHLAEHPAYGLVHEIMRVVQVNLCIAKTP